MTKKSTRDLVIFIAVVLLSLTFCFAKPVKPLHNGYYRWKALHKRGYECKPFKGSIFITYGKYLELVNNKSIIK
jgi:hypothetical protein